ncbi:MAG: GDP-mannose 4,6-dehydratase [Pseudomonadota bacterium]|nr:GDP-mannose 4,6-dehydratase [Pseudomonadota bacterium]
MAQKIAVIGSNSFSGACFADYALRQGAEVIGISRSPEPHKAFLPYRWSGKDKAFRFYAYDLNHHLDDTMALLKAEKTPIIVNFAAQSMVGQSWKTPEHWFQTNVVSTVKFHDRLRQCDFLDRYVHITTPEVYGSTGGFITEEAPFNPSTPYAVSRAAADMSLKSFFQAYGFPVVYTRAANVYGPGQQLYRIIPRTILFVRLGRKLSLHGGGQSERSFIHMNDVSDGTWRIMTDGKPGECYHISGEETVTIRQLVERICEKMSVPFDDIVEMADERLGKDAAYKLDSSKLRRTLGWKDKIPLDQGIDECISWVDTHLAELQKQPFDYVHKP